MKNWDLNFYIRLNKNFGLKFVLKFTVVVHVNFGELNRWRCVWVLSVDIFGNEISCLTLLVKENAGIQFTILLFVILYLWMFFYLTRIVSL
jgi:hypothetical protein